MINIYNQFQGTYTLRIIEDFYELWWKIFPYILVSIALNIIAVRYIHPKRFLNSGTSETISIFIAAGAGLISPLPTYAAIPIALSLMSSGLRLSAVISFIIASPLMNPTIFFLTASQMGIEMALARTIAAFLIAVAGGFLTAKVFTNLFQPQTAAVRLRSAAKKTLMQDIAGNAKYMLKYFSIAIFLSSLVKAFVSPETVTHLLGGNGRTGTLLAMAMGIPFYTCGGSAIPFMETLMELGMQKGPILAFFLVGPATKLETLYAYKSQLGVKVLLFYLILTFSCSFIAGMVYSLF